MSMVLKSQRKARRRRAMKMSGTIHDAARYGGGVVDWDKIHGGHRKDGRQNEAENGKTY